VKERWDKIKEEINEKRNRNRRKEGQNSQYCSYRIFLVVATSRKPYELL
jgi:hypothetical protein